MNSAYFTDQIPTFRMLKDSLQMNKYRPLPRTSITAEKPRVLGSSQSLDKLPLRRTLARKQTSTGDPNFTVVFQAIEIERLQAELQSARYRVRDYEKQMGNSQNYEVQIKQLSEQCVLLEGEIRQYREQLEKMNAVCQKMHQQNQTLRQKIRQDIGKREGLGGSPDKSKQNMLNAKIKQLENRLAAKNQQHTRIEQMLKQKQAEAERWQKLAMSNSRNQMISNESIAIEKTNRSEDTPNKIDRLSEQIYRLTQIIYDKNTLIQELQGRADQTHRMKQLKSQLAQYRQKYKDIQRDLQQINSLRLICQRQQKQILQNFKQKKTDAPLAVATACFDGSAVRSPAKLEPIMSRIRSLESTIETLQAKYSNLLSQASRL